MVYTLSLQREFQTVTHCHGLKRRQLKIIHQIIFY